jgi:hypothetical protein
VRLCACVRLNDLLPACRLLPPNCLVPFIPSPSLPHLCNVLRSTFIVWYRTQNNNLSSLAVTALPANRFPLCLFVLLLALRRTLASARSPPPLKGRSLTLLPSSSMQSKYMGATYKLPKIDNYFMVNCEYGVDQLYHVYRCSSTHTHSHTHSHSHVHTLTHTHTHSGTVMHAITSTHT